MRHSDSGPCRTPSLHHSPSFTEYSSGTMADTVARVVSEFADLPYYYHDNDDAVLYHNDVVADVTKSEILKEEGEEDDSSFEFPVPGRGEDSSPVSADEIFNNGQIRPLLPLFNTDLVFADTDWRVDHNFEAENRSPAPEVEVNPYSIGIPLKKLMISERVTSMTESVSCSSSEADDLEGLAPDMYCEWNPSKQEMRKKSKSTGSSKRWNFRDILYRSHSDGGEAFAVLSSKHQRKPRNSVDGGKKNEETVSAEKARAIRESDRKRSDVPYSRDSAGFFARMNELSRTIQPF